MGRTSGSNWRCNGSYRLCIEDLEGGGGSKQLGIQLRSLLSSGDKRIQHSTSIGSLIIATLIDLALKFCMFLYLVQNSCEGLANSQR